MRGDTTPSPGTRHQLRWLMSPETVSSQCKVVILGRGCKQYTRTYIRQKRNKTCCRREKTSNTRSQNVLSGGPTRGDKPGKCDSRIYSRMGVSESKSQSSRWTGCQGARERSDTWETQGQTWELEGKETQQDARQPWKTMDRRKCFKKFTRKKIARDRNTM